MSGLAGHAYLQGCGAAAPGYFGQASLERDCSCVTAACMVVRRAAFEQLGGFDEALAIAFNDVDLCIRLRQAGWRIVWTPAAELYHHESASLGRHDSPARRADFRREVAMMQHRWADVLAADPFHNPNLSLSSNCPTLAFPPRIAKLPA